MCAQDEERENTEEAPLGERWRQRDALIPHFLFHVANDSLL